MEDWGKEKFAEGVGVKHPSTIQDGGIKNLFFFLGVPTGCYPHNLKYLKEKLLLKMKFKEMFLALNPLTPGPFCQKRIFWTYLEISSFQDMSQISSNLLKNAFAI